MSIPFFIIITYPFHKVNSSEQIIDIFYLINKMSHHDLCIFDTGVSFFALPSEILEFSIFSRPQRVVFGLSDKKACTAKEVTNEIDINV